MHDNARILLFITDDRRGYHNKGPRVKPKLDAQSLTRRRIIRNHDRRPSSMNPSQKTFKVGLSPDWTDWAPGILEVAMAEVLEPLPGLTHEVMPDHGGAATSEIDNYDAIIAFALRFPGEAFQGIERLSCIARWGVGFDTVDVAAATAADVMISLCPRAVQRSMAEGIVTLMLTLAKNVRTLD